MYIIAYMFSGCKQYIAPRNNKGAKQLYGVDMERTQHPKLLSDLPSVDVVVTMGCNVQRPALPCKFRED